MLATLDKTLSRSTLSVQCKSGVSTALEIRNVGKVVHVRGLDGVALNSDSGGRDGRCDLSGGRSLCSFSRPFSAGGGSFFVTFLKDDCGFFGWESCAVK